MLTLNNSSTVNWLKKRLIDHEIVQGNIEEGKHFDIVVCGSGSGSSIEDQLEKVHNLLKETGSTIPVIFLLNEESNDMKKRLMSIGLSEGWIVSPRPGKTIRASELLQILRRVAEETEELDPPVFADTPDHHMEDKPEESGDKENQIICISSSKRGCGCDTVATSLAAHAAEAGLKVAYIDLGEPPCAGFHLGIPEPTVITEPAVYETKWGTLVVPGDDAETIFEDIVSKHDVTVLASPNRLMQIEEAKEVVVLDRDIKVLEITSIKIEKYKNKPVIFVNRSSEKSRPDAACIFEQKGYKVITAGTDTAGCIRALADGKPALTRSAQMAQAIGKLASTLKLLG